MAMSPTQSRELVPREIHLDPEAMPALVDNLLPEGLRKGARLALDDAAEILAVADPTDYQLALDTAGRCKGISAAIKDLAGPLADVLHRMHRAVTGRRAELIGRHDSEALRLERLANDWQREENRKRAMEAERLRREQEAAMRAERELVEREAQERAAALEAVGKTEEAAAEIEQAAAEIEGIESTAVEVLPAPAVAPEIQRAAGGAKKTEIAVEITDLAAFLKWVSENPGDREPFVAINLGELKRRAQRMGVASAPPGVRFSVEQGVRAKAR